MVQGTGSSVGKSLLATALCRIFRQDGYNVAPFKAQNMSLNSFVTAGGAEIGRSQAVQAQAAGVPPTADMNPVLLKPEANYRSQLIVMGSPVGSYESKNFDRPRPGLWEVVASSLDRLRSEFDVVVIEGAGSPAEINLRRGDIVNMEVALHAGSPVLLVGDIDKGGIFASLYGTVMLLSPEERELVAGTVINKFRGDVSILLPGLGKLEELTGVPVLGVVPYFDDIYVSEEDSPSVNSLERADGALLDVAIIALPHISNFDDFDPLSQESGVGLRYVRSPGQLGRPDMVIILGTKTTTADLGHLRRTGLADKIVSLAGDGVAVVGICGGLQMLGRTVLDPDRVESDEPNVDDLGLLPVVTRFDAHKETHQVTGRVTADHGLLNGARGLEYDGYEIHMGSSIGSERHPFTLTSRSGVAAELGDGAISDDGWVLGTYVHGIFHSADLRRIMLRRVAERKGVSLPPGDHDFSQSAEYDKLADLFRANLEMKAVYRISGLKG